ncbi:MULTISPECIES: outer membrane protein assembly factor BamE [Methylobacterium]|jgi:outer membrane protein assembly factor BamE (lipoprotein component of BamABCDE complex)|uniref:Outer membrane protein assembly factor BamE n=1 Tax=Methylobacterium hispanicum TaxID=270350 RepID=A0AAV4ZW98_9HYPH|nr:MULTISPECIES: outer membrane protein assembly factor BamE [Methylobacterium]GJD91785.1 Outer membrane protein assembly factor BamE [Methylobacterium hispanicum]
MRRRLVSSLARVALLGGLGVALSGCIGEEIRHGYQLDQAALAAVKPGMSAEQVLQTLGTPSTVSTVGNKSWYYISQNTSRTVMFLGERVDDQKVTAVYFTPAFKVERVALYGLQDGKVFDFIERTTPTSGQDRAFLSQLFRGLTRYEPFGSGSGTSIVPGANRGM